MRIVEPRVEVVKPQGNSIQAQYKLAEIAGRISYLSQDRITDESYKEFVQRLIKLKHYSPLEFATVYLKIKYDNPQYLTVVNKYRANKYSIVHEYKNVAYITTNFRVIMENDWHDDFAFLHPCTECHEERIMVHFTLPISISREFIRHRSFSFMEMSTRYVNIAKDKYGGQLEVIQPVWFKNRLGEYTDEDIVRAAYDNTNEADYAFISSIWSAEMQYKKLVQAGKKPQEAREVLPLATRTELYMCGFRSDWDRFLELRRGSNAHPMAKHLADSLYYELHIAENN